MRWIVFGDDWGVHPSTTQHLILNMPPQHRAVWVDSIGMRAPTLNLVDLRRVLNKVGSFLDATAENQSSLYKGSIGHVRRLKPKVLPWHSLAMPRRYNSRWLAKMLRDICADWPHERTAILAANPVAALYADHLPHDALVYLRLDEYKEYPGCDRDLVEQTEALMYQKAHAVVATAQALIPQSHRAKSHYLPQGVQTDVFSAVALEPAKRKVLGFFGTLAEWLDFDLIDAVAATATDWQLEFVGKQDHVPASLRARSNIVLRPPVPFARLPEIMSSWAAAWIPFQVNALTVGVNPLKVREYLAAGMPTHCTPLPEVSALSDEVLISASAADVVRWMNDVLATDTAADRARRRARVATDSWASRAIALTEIAEGRADNQREYHLA